MQDKETQKYAQYDNTTVRIDCNDGRSYTGACQWYPWEYGDSEYGREEESLRIGFMFFFASDILHVELIRPEACIPIREYIEAGEDAAKWFHEKWHIPLSAYEESISECIGNAVDIDIDSIDEDDAAGYTAGTVTSRTPVPQWYIVLRGSRIIAGCGVIENDFHDRKDLAPNVCAVYVEEEFRGQGIAGFMLDFVCRDMAALGVPTLYLLTDHTGFYERYGWKFLCMAQGDGEPEPSRMYVHTEA